MFVVRKAKASDSAAICKICGEDLGYTCGIELVQSKMKKLDDSREIVFIAEINNMVVGFVHAEKYDVLYYDTMVNILGLAVAEEYRHKVIGSLLLKAVEQWSEEKNIHFVRLNSGTTRVEAHKFYRTNGYRDDKEQKRFIKRI